MKKKNLSSYENTKVPDGSEFSIGIVVSEWNEKVTGALFEGAKKTLLKHGVSEENIHVRYVPGSFELTFGAKAVAEMFEVDAVIAIGCVVRGETPHFDFVSNAVATGLTALNAEHHNPFVFCVLTTDTMEQALARAGGEHGNKGVEAAITAIKMAVLRSEMIENILKAELEDDDDFYDDDDDDFDDDFDDDDDDFEEEDDEDDDVKKK